MNQKRIIFLSILIIGVLTLSLGVTFAIFNFNKTSTNSKLVAGDIYMHYNEINQLTIENAMPSDNYDNTNYFEFTVDGKNTTTDKDIWYDIVLSHGDDYTTRTTRIKDNLLNFRLVEVVDSVETVLIENNSYNDLTSKRIWVDTISKDTTNEVTHTYRLYMWIDKNTKIGNVNQDYTMEEGNDVYASIKVNVTGDFNVKNVSVTDESCFSYQEIEGGIEINDYDQSCGTDVIIPDTINGLDVISINTIMHRIDESNSSISGGFMHSNLHSVILPKKLKNIGFSAFSGNQLTRVVIPNSVTTIDWHAFSINKLTTINIPDSVTTIGEWAFSGNQLTTVNIPDSVTEIRTGAFFGNQLTSVTIGNGIQYIWSATFYKDSSSNPNLSNITINKSCSDIKNIPRSSTSNNKYYPWLYDESPYTAEGVTIYGSGGEVCDSY